jgi:nitrite reductase (cytochrome c-552)
MAKEGDAKEQKSLRFFLAVAVIAVIAGVGAAALLVDILERQKEAENPFFRVVELDENTTDPAVWGKNFPLQYDQYKRTVDMVRTSYGGSESMSQTPTDVDPRSVVASSRIEEDPRLKTMWAGYAFSVDFREERGHAYMLVDQEFTMRQKFAQQPGTCLHCHASVWEPYRKMGNGDVIKGFEMMNPMTYEAARKFVEHPVACIDCHNPQTMQLRVTRPGFLEGIKAYKASQGVENYDVNTMASHQEMRAYVCGQCHVEYYFKGKEKRLTYPWSKGLKADEILTYYEEVGFSDWKHKETGAEVLKAQHPEFEMWNQGVHARSGVTCADCHMPYIRVGAQKISDHHVRSPLLNINNACQTCHHQTEEELLQRAENIQRNTAEMRDIALDGLVQLIGDIKTAQADGVDVTKLQSARGLQRKAQFLLDFVESENSMGFHASQEAARLLVKSLNYTREGQLALRQEQQAK